MNVKDKTQFECSSLTLTGKAGSDGSSNYGAHMHIQSTTEFENNNYDDDKLFLIAYVPLKLVAANGQVIWSNPRPSSPRYCRPVKFLYTKETKDVVIREIKALQSEMDNLQSTIIEGGIEVKHKVYFTMVDGKTINILTETANARCNLCRAGPKQLSDLSTVRNREIDENSLLFGLSTLHAWIKFMECILHISYKLFLKQPTIRNATLEQRAVIQQREKEIPLKLTAALGIVVDQVTHGSGTSNTGNIARKFFSNYEIVGQITGVDPELIKRFGIIMIALSSGHRINDQQFETYTWQTAERMMDLYPWFQMGPSVHKVLIHGAQVIRALEEPIGIFSEEAQESVNKFYRINRSLHTRKISRLATTTDLFNIMLVNSDPVITHLRGLPSQKKKEIPAEAQELLSF